MNNKRITKTLILLALVIFLAPSAYGIQVSVQSNGAGYSTYIQATKDQFLNAFGTIGETGISHTITGTANLAESHYVSDRAGDYAEVGAQIKGAKSPYTYSYQLYPGQCGGKGTDNVWAMEALNVPSASLINAYSTASNMAGYSTGVSTTLTGTGSSLLGYSNIAYASAGAAGAAQSFDGASSSLIQTGTWSDQAQLQLKPLGLKVDDVSSGIAVKSGSITGYKDLATASTGKLDASEHMDSASGSQIQTQSKYLSASASLLGGLKSTTVDSVTTTVTGTLSGYNADSQKSGDVSGAQQTGHVAGTFTSTATSGTATKTRSSDYGTNYDLNMQAKKDSSGSYASGVLGYYVNPGMANLIPGKGAIQGAVDTAQSGDTVNAAAGSYGENVAINKALGLVGQGSGATTTSFTLNNGASILSNSQGLNAPTVNVNNGAKIQDGVTLTSSGGTINVAAGSYGENVVINKALGLVGLGTGATTTSFTLNNGASILSNSQGLTAPTVNVNNGAKIQDGVTLATSGGTVNAGPGTYRENVVVNKNVAIQGAGAGSTIVDGGHAGSVFTVNSGVNAQLSGMTIQGGTGTSFLGSLMGGGIFNRGQLTVDGCTISGNSQSSSTNGVGGGISNFGTATFTDSTISGNSASNDGGGIFNAGTATFIDSTISGNSASSTNGGGGIYNDGTATFTSSTISGNSAPRGGGIENPSGTVTINGGTIGSNSGNGIDNDALLILNPYLGQNIAIKSNTGYGIYNSIYATYPDYSYVNFGTGLDANTLGDHYP